MSRAAAGSPRAGAGISRFGRAEIEQSVGGRFDRIARAHADRPAVRARGVTTTYARLAEYADRVAAGLATVPTPAGPVALMIEPGPELFAAMLGALKAGRVYAPLDPALGAGRLREILAALEAPLVLTDASQETAARMQAGHAEVRLVSALGGGPAPSAATVSPDALAYVLFTSGSTGTPKGVLQNHRSLLHNVAKLTESLAIGPEDRVSLLSSVSFGASVSDVFGALLNGACVCPFSLRGGGLAHLAAWLEEEGVTIYHSVPSVFRAFAGTLEPGPRFPRVRAVKLGGEPVRSEDFELFRRAFPRSCRLHVGLGSTEMHVVRHFVADHDTVWPEAPPLGYAVDDTEIVLLDDDGRESGHEGEIAIVARTLAAGYWRDPVRTRQEFRAVAGRDGYRMFRTGDRGCLREDGCLLYLGRKGSRVKIRGHRVEVEDVEAALRRVAGVRESAVAGRPATDGETRLVAYIVAERGPAPSVGALRSALAAILPDYMLPAVFVFLGALPRTATGKLDRPALPDPPSERPRLDTPYVVPRTEFEEVVARVFAEALGLDCVGADDDFFELGGSSLLAAKAVARLQEIFGDGVGIADLIEAPTPAGLARRPRAGISRAFDPVVTLQRGGDPPVFIVPGGAGEAADLLVSARLARRVGPDPSFLGFRAERGKSEDLEDLVSGHLRSMRERQPRGPYRLVGECVGGILALEMARRLREEGEDVALLVLLDTPFPGWRRRVSLMRRLVRAASGFGLLARVGHHGRAMKAMDPARWGAYLLEKIRVGLRALAPARRSEQLGALRERASYASRLLASRPGPWEGRIGLVESAEGAAEGHAAAWADRYPQIEIAAVPGDHRTYIQEHVDRVAEALRRWMAPGPSARA